MSRLIIVFPTLTEAAPLLDKISHRPLGSQLFQGGQVDIIITQPGVFPMTFHLTRHLSSLKKLPELAILAGVAGAFNRSLKIGDICYVDTEQFADIGAENSDGQFLLMDQLNLWPKEWAGSIPAVKWSLHGQNPHVTRWVSSITVNICSGDQHTIHKRKTQFQADIENMEGAAFYQICSQYSLPALQIRAISNYVEPRNKENWNIPLAIQNLSKHLIKHFIPA